ncbi:hypothetical protein SETIT_5G143200v2 [Setaria italica]|uniref:Uncharacterized protein n=1 Tax=Setaria italica TaxID=4555 RepID=A0A368R4M1_SETIT|nr:hypothetical protein SETIT_5G143200v2 [Setaria italica]
MILDLIAGRGPAIREGNLGGSGGDMGVYRKESGRRKRPRQRREAGASSVGKRDGARGARVHALSMRRRTRWLSPPNGLSPASYRRLPCTPRAHRLEFVLTIRYFAVKPELM